MVQRYYYEQKKFQCNIISAVGGRKHMHNELELLYVKSGRILAFHHFKEYILNPGDFLLIFPNTIHSFKIVEEPIYMLSIFDKNLFSNYTNIFSSKYVTGNPVSSKSNMHLEVDFCIDQIFSREELQGRHNLTDAYLMIILENILSQLSLAELSEKKSSDWLQDVLLYLNENYTKKIYLDDLASKFGFSKSYLSRSFNAKIDSSITEYVNRLRVEYAIRLLEGTDKSITTIAFECGFDSLATFFRAFQKNGEGSPHTYRDKASLQL